MLPHMEISIQFERNLQVDRQRSKLYYVQLINSLIAQLVERRTVNPQVPGSSPGRGARYRKAYSDVGLFSFIELVGL